MATIQKVKRRSDYAYRALIRQAGMKSVTKRYAHLCIEHKSSLINRVMGGI